MATIKIMNQADITGLGSSVTKVASPSGNATTSYLMSGLAAPVTPTFTGRVLVTICGQVTNATTNDGSLIQIAYGTGSAPVNGAAASGTVVGSPTGATIAGGPVPFSLTVVVTGLNIGTAYWFDAQIKAVTGGTVSLSNVTVTLVEC